tara:strand:- start:3785 stop:4360 length:576 start_codon:yes stop_codon:yes gene_type:complete
MFNGIIKYTGRVVNIIKNKNEFYIYISSKIKFSKNEIGSSISCSGACLTLENFNRKIGKFYLSKETLNRTNFRYLKKKSIVNLEKSLRYGDRISGHFVQGHVDTTSKILNINVVGKSWYIDLSLSKKYKKFIIEKGSIAINGVSLTIAKKFQKMFRIVVIPQTLKFTNLIKLKKNDVVNIEFDILSKYKKA